jgi:hypothetical protein
MGTCIVSIFQYILDNWTPDDGWKYHPKHIEQFPDINKLCNVASCWIYEYIGMLLGAHPILHISRIRVNVHRLKVEVCFYIMYHGVLQGQWRYISTCC